MSRGRSRWDEPPRCSAGLAGMDDGRAHDVHGAALTPKLVLVLLLRRSARWGMIGSQ